MLWIWVANDCMKLSDYQLLDSRAETRFLILVFSSSQISQRRRITITFLNTDLV